MNYTVDISPEVYTLVQQQAQQAQIAPNLLVETALRRYLLEQDSVWRQQFLALIARVQEYTRNYSSQEIEDDITAAALEVKELRHARRCSG